MRHFLVILGAFLILAPVGRAEITFVNLGLTAPPPVLGTIPVARFDPAPQSALADGAAPTNIPGCPIPGQLTLSANLTKQTVPDSWLTWSHGYTGPVFAGWFRTNITLHLPTNTTAFYFYIEPERWGNYAITATANDGTSSGPIMVAGSAGANGFGFYTGSETQTIAMIHIVVERTAYGFAIGEFGISTAAAQIPTLTEWGLGIMALLLAGLALRKTGFKVQGLKFKVG